MRELRIGLVLYGGVSLAVYINGIVTEIWHALRASQQHHGRQKGPPPSGSVAVYAELLQQLAADPGGTELRLVLDAVAGTSAGGVNGAALAKAIAEGGDAAVLNRVWIEEADIAALRAEPAARAPFALRAALWTLRPLVPALGRLHRQVEALPGLSWPWLRDSLYAALAVPDGAATPLDGRYFARMIARTLGRIGGGAPPLLPDRGTFDLFLTRTDLHGWPRHLPLSRALHPDDLYERTHAHVMAFRHRPGGATIGHDFDLAYAARTTAGFPAAFAPVNYREMEAAWREERPGEEPPTEAEFSARHLRENVLATFRPAHAWMVDGGILDNKPFSHVAAAIEDKPADHEVYRMLVYVEPDPEVEVEPPPAELPLPPAVLKGLFRLFRHEPIQADLRALQDRNARAEALRAMRRAAQAEAAQVAAAAAAEQGLAWPVAAGELGRWQEEMNRRAARRPAPGYGGYVALKARRAAGILAGLLCDALGYPYHSRHGYLVRALTRAWLSREGALEVPAPDEAGGTRLGARQMRLLQAFDLPYRLRRVRTLVQAVNEGYGRAPAGTAGPQWRDGLDAAKCALSDVAFSYERAFRDSGDLADRIADAFDGILDLEAEGGMDAAIAQLKLQPAVLAARHDAEIAPLFDALADRYAAHAEAETVALFAAVEALPEPLRGEVARTAATFPLVDVTLFPAMDMAGIDDPIAVETMRVSPRDATFLSDEPHRLQGRELGAFAGFLKRSAREHDLLWGRLDGAERLIGLIVAAASAPAPAAHAASGPALEALRRDHTRRAVLAILDEEEARPGSTVGAEVRRLRQKLGAGAGA